MKVKMTFERRSTSDSSMYYGTGLRIAGSPVCGMEEGAEFNGKGGALIALFVRNNRWV